MFKKHILFHIFYIVAAPLFPVFSVKKITLIGRLDQGVVIGQPFTISVSFNTLMQLKVMCTFPEENSRLQLMHYRESRNSVH